MAKHSEILNNFKAIIHDFDFKNKDHRLLVRESDFIFMTINSLYIELFGNNRNM